MLLSPLFAKKKEIVSHNIYMLAKIRNDIDAKCALADKRPASPLLDYSGCRTI